MCIYIAVGRENSKMGFKMVIPLKGSQLGRIKIGQKINKSRNNLLIEHKLQIKLKSEKIHFWKKK